MFESWPRYTKGIKNGTSGCLACAQLYKASTGISSPNKYRITNILQNLQKMSKKKTKKTVNNQCVYSSGAVWKIGSHAKYVIFLKYETYNNIKYNIIYI